MFLFHIYFVTYRFRIFFSLLLWVTEEFEALYAETILIVILLGYIFYIYLIYLFMKNKEMWNFPIEPRFLSSLRGQWSFVTLINASFKRYSFYWTNKRRCKIDTAKNIPRCKKKQKVQSVYNFFRSTVDELDILSGQCKLILSHRKRTKKNLDRRRW